MLVLRPRHRSLRSGLASATSGGGGGGFTASLSGKAAAFSAGTLSYPRSKTLAGQAAAFAGGSLAFERSDFLASEDSSFQAGQFGAFDIGERIDGSAAAFATGVFTNKIRTDLLTGKAVTVTPGTLVYNAPPPVIQVLLNGSTIVVSAGTVAVGSIKSANLTGKSAAFSAGVPLVVRADALTGKAAAFTAGTVSTGLYNVAATTDGANVTITATSSLDLSDPARYGVEFGDGSGGVYQWAVSEPGAVSSQSITIGPSDGVVPGHILSYRVYYNLTNSDPLSSRVYGPSGEILVDVPGTLTGKAITSATGSMSVIRTDALVGTASSAAAFTPGTLVVGQGSTADLTGKAATFSQGAFAKARTGTIAGQAADFAPGPAGFTSEFDALILGQG